MNDFDVLRIYPALFASAEESVSVPGNTTPRHYAGPGQNPRQSKLG